MDTLYTEMVDRRRIHEVLAPEAGDRMLEVGIGTGKNLKYYPASTTTFTRARFPVEWTTGS